MKNFFLRSGVRLGQTFLKRHSGTNRILLLSTTALGDTLWATPTIEAIRRSFPSATLALLTSPIGREIMQGNPHLDAIYLYRPGPSLWKRLYRERFDTVLSLHTSQRVALPFAALLGASRLIGTAGLHKGLDDLLTEALPPRYEHEIERRLHLAEAIGAKASHKTLSLFLSPEELAQGKGWFQKKPNEKIVLLHPGSKDPFKRWPLSSFVAVAKELAKRPSHRLFVSCGLGEEHLIEPLLPFASPLPHTSLRPFASFLAASDLLLTNDTGPFHLASALGTPAIALYSPTDPHLCGPYEAPHSLALYRPPTCTPCLKRRCRRPFCLLQITPADVLSAIGKLLCS